MATLYGAVGLKIDWAGVMLRLGDRAVYFITVDKTHPLPGLVRPHPDWNTFCSWGGWGYEKAQISQATVYT